MGTAGKLCTLLLLVGTSCAYPQYGGTQQEEQEPALPSVTQLTEQEKVALHSFWWKEKGIFENQGQSPKSDAQTPAEFDIPFIPVASPECQPAHACIPSKHCIEGKFTNTGEGLIGLRISPLTSEYSETPCGQTGNVCCRIPDGILAAQQQGQSGGTGYSGGGPGISDGGSVPEIIEVISTDGSSATGGTQTAGGSGDDGASGGTGINPQHVEETQIQDTSSECPLYTHDCVPHFQCIDGEINTSGEGLIDVRINIKTDCTNSANPEVPGVCCRIPGATPPPTPAPLQTCPGSNVCVAQGQCNPEGTVNTDGTGLIDTRLHISCFLESSDPSNSVTGVCCEPPPTPPPTPDPLLTCPGTQECVEPTLCNPDGTVNTDGSDIINIRTYQKPCYIDAASYTTGVCCQPPTPPTPAPLQVCPNDLTCASQVDCQSWNADTAGAEITYGSCYLESSDPSNSVTGVCCESPSTPTPTPGPLLTCPDTHECVEQDLCDPDGIINTDGSGIINIRTYRKPCYIDAASYTTGVCCQPPTPPTPAPLQECPNSQTCASDVDCQSWNADTAGAGITYETSCYTDFATYTTGVCCPPKPPVTPAPLQECPNSQTCASQADCQSWNAATAGGGIAYETTCYTALATYTTGVCCPPKPPVTPAPLQECPNAQTCASQADCQSWNAATIGAGITYTTSCYSDLTAYVTGVCCPRPPPVTPAPLETCPGAKVCLPDCASESDASSGAGASYDSCVLETAGYTGVCCDSPIRVVDSCPGNAVCLPEILCQGEIYDVADQYSPYESKGTWAPCDLGLGTPGVCCRNLEPIVTTPSPYTPADKCGVRNYGLGLRFGGSKLEKNEAQFGEFSWQAIIFFTNFTYKCGASVIADRWLITAAHCVHGYQYSDFKIRLGEWQVDKYDEPLPYVDAEIASITIHPEFKPGPVPNDIALIQLTAPIKYEYHINAICLPDEGQIPAADTRCFATGWGKDAFSGQYQPILKKIELPVVEKSYCQTLLRKTRLGKYFQLHDSFMCAGAEENRDVCKGDGGGPLICENTDTGRYYITGITAWGIDCGVKDVPGVYVDVQKFRPWINGIINLEIQEPQSSLPGYGGK